MRFKYGWFGLLLSMSVLPGWGGEVHPADLLPPVHPWNGESETLIWSGETVWNTPAESSQFRVTPSYEETEQWLRKLTKKNSKLRMISIGKSFEGRDLWMVLVSGDQRQPEDRRRPLVLVQAGIHAGEIDGKDAGLMLLRDLALQGQKSWLDKVDLLFIPILNVDGHERSSPHGRMNQRGPDNMGWRTNARNQNLNRDYAKLDTPEVRAVVRVIEEWDPDLYVDLHVTDGSDYQYDITFGWAGTQGHSPSTARWLDRNVRPKVERQLVSMGHIPGPLVFLMDKKDPNKGRYGWMAGPRFSDGYGSARHLPTILVENHSLKPYRQRVLGTYVFLEALLSSVGESFVDLRAAHQVDRKRRLNPVTLDWKVARADPPRVPFKGIQPILAPSKVSGTERVTWNAEPREFTIPLYDNREVAKSVVRPRAYWVPPTFPEVVQRLEIHGIQVERLRSPRTIEVSQYRLSGVEMGESAYEGHHRIDTLAVASEKRQVTYPVGSVRIVTDQSLGHLAVLLLEPESPDSFLRWGFFNEILQRTEYAESYALEALAEAMLRESPDLRVEFEKKVESDDTFRADPRARLHFFYQRSPWYDERFLLYPVGREEY